MKYLLILMFGVSILSGCTPNIVDRDFEQEELDYMKKYGEFAKADPLWQNPTPDSLMLNEMDAVIVTIHKTAPDDDEGIMLQNWVVVVTNHNTVDKCVFIAWKLQGFRVINEHAGFRKILKHQSIPDFATMKQTIWDPTGLRIALPPSGYIEEMEVLDINSKSTNEDEECEFFETEDNIVEM